jgi:hypothetical protein
MILSDFFFPFLFEREMERKLERIQTDISLTIAKQILYLLL